MDPLRPADAGLPDPMDQARPLPPTLRIEARHNGPLHSGNGGWTAGALARWLAGDGPVAVSLRAPVPLERELPVTEGPGDTWRLMDGPALIAEAARENAWTCALPTLPDDEAVAQAAALGRLLAQRRGTDSPYARCFACGFARDDGLAVVPGVVDAEAALVAAHWTPAPALAEPGQGGRVRAEALWAALDCPAGVAWGSRLGQGAAMVTVRMALQQLAPVRTGQRYRVLGWPLARDGRKLHAATALVDADGQVCAHTRQLWLMPREDSAAVGAAG